MKKILFIISIVLFLYFFLNKANSQPWVQHNSGTTSQLNSVSASKTNLVWACGNNGTVLRTIWSGNNWVNATGNGIPSTLNLLNIFSHKSQYGLPPSQLDYAYITGTDGAGSYIYMTSDGGSNWNKVLTVTGTGARINSIWFKDTLNGFAEGEPIAGRWSFWKTTNHGLNWDSAGLYLYGQNYKGFPNNLSGKLNTFHNNLYIGTNFNNTETRLLRSTDFGSSWTILDPGINKSITSIFFVNTEFGMIGGDNYVYYTTNSGNNWILAADLPYTPNLVGSVTDTYSIYNFYIKTDSNNIQSIYDGYGFPLMQRLNGINGMNHMQGINAEMWVVGDSGKIYYRGVLYPGVKKTGNEIPESYNLHQNYPNPFNPTTNIKFDIQKTSVTKMIIYDALGREVATIVNEVLKAGSYQVDWYGSNYPSGVYFYTLHTGDFIETKKMLLLK